MKKDYYKILEVDSEASDEEIRTAYLKLALKWHPDKHNGDDAGHKFQEIGEAYQVLSDPMQRAEYDESTDYDVAELALEEYLCRFQTLILTVNGLGMDAPGATRIAHEGLGFGGLLGVN